MELADVLEAMDAPDALVDGVRRDALDLGEAWETCVEADHRVWLAASAGAPVEVLVEASASAVLVLLERLGDPSPVLADAAQLAVAGASARELGLAAERCEEIAERGAGYRDAAGLDLGHAARAAALVARAGEGLAQGEARREAVRLDRAQHMASMLGAAVHAVLPANADAARVDVNAIGRDPAQGAFVYAVAACAEALREVASLREVVDPDELDAIVRSVLEEGES